MAIADFFIGMAVGAIVLYVLAAVVVVVGLVILVIYLLTRKEKHLKNLPPASTKFKLDQGKEVNKKKE